MTQKMKPQKGKYSKKRTRRGNVQIGRLKGKSNVRIVRDMIGLKNLNKGKRAVKKWESTGKLALEREKNKLE